MKKVQLRTFLMPRGWSYHGRMQRRMSLLFLADEIYEAIKVINFNASSDECFNPFKSPQSPKSDLVNYCSSGREYLVPLYLLTGNNDAWLTQILTRIADNIQIDILEKFDLLDEKEREDFVKSTLTEDIQELAENPDRICEREEFKKELKKQGDIWAGSVKTYLVSCLNGIQLNQIIVDNHNRARAINIYENLNKGGVPLGTFELVMAKFASVSNENYYDKLVGNIKKKRKYLHDVYSRELYNNNDIKRYIDSDEYNASLRLKCLDDNDEMAGAYIDAYLDVMSLYSHCPNFEVDKLNVALIKREKILAVSPTDLKERCDDVCDALDQALFFMQMRCGIRSIKEINYGLMLVVIAYLLLKPEYRDKRRTYDYLDAWYWASVFSGFFNTDQTERAVSSIKHLIETLDSDDASWIKNLEKQMFDVPYFTEKEFILLEKDEDTGILPKEFLRDVICQFFMVKTYKGIIDSSVLLTPFTSETLEKHHLIPLGSLVHPDEKIKNSGEKLRNNKKYFLNTPVNFIYITERENIAISDDKLSDYAPRIKSYASKAVLGLSGTFDTSSDDKCKEILANRYDNLVGKVQQHIEILIP